MSNATFTIEVTGGDGGEQQPPGGDATPWALPFDRPSQSAPPPPVVVPWPSRGDRPPPVAPISPVGGDRETSDATAFDRPQAVVVMGPRPLPVAIVSGGMSENRPERDPQQQPRTNYAKLAFDLLAGGIRGAGAGAAGAAGNAAMPAFQNAIGVATAGLSRLGPYGMAAGAALQVVGTAATAVKQTIDALVNRAKELLPFSAAIAGSSARAEVRRVQGDVREAERLGPQFARLIEAQSRAEATMQRLIEPIKAFILDRLVAFLERGERGLLELLEGLDKLTLGKVESIRQLITDIKGILDGPGDITLIDRWIAPVAPPAAAPAPARVPLMGGR